MITLACPEHGRWQADLKDHRSRSTCPAPGCSYRGVPRREQFQARAGAGAPAVNTSDQEADTPRLAGLQAAIGPLPALLQAAIMFCAGAAAYRWHHGGRPGSESAHAGIIAVSDQDSGVGKTLTGLVIGKALGLTAAQCWRSVPAESERSLQGRHSTLAGGRFIASDVLSLPFVLLDEIGDAGAEARQAAMWLMHGESVVTIEGQQVQVRCTPYAAGNIDLAAVEPRVRRRCPVLNLTGQPRIPRQLAEAVLAAVPALPYDSVTPPAELPGPLREQLRSATAGLELDPAAVEHAACGLAALADNDLTAAAALAAGSVLTLAAAVPRAGSSDRAMTGTVVVPGARPGDDEPDPADSYLDRFKARGMAGTFKARLSRALDAMDDAAELPGVPASWADQAEGLSHAARDLLKDLGSARDLDRLAEIAEAAAEAVRMADDLAQLMRQAAAPAIAELQRRDHQLQLTAAEPSAYATEIKEAMLRRASAPLALPAARQQTTTCPRHGPVAGPYCAQCTIPAGAPIGLLRRNTRRIRKPPPAATRNNQQPASAAELRFGAGIGGSRAEW